MLECPVCHSSDIHRSRTRSLVERLAAWFKAKHRYRCRACGYRGAKVVHRPPPSTVDWDLNVPSPNLAEIQKTFDSVLDVGKREADLHA